MILKLVEREEKIRSRVRIREALFVLLKADLETGEQ